MVGTARVVALGTTVLMTTQYLDEADQLADRIAIIDHGKVIAQGTSGELKALVGSGTLRVSVLDPDQRDEARRVLADVFEAQVELENDQTGLSVRAPDPEQVGNALVELSRAGVLVKELALGQPSLDEVFLNLTGHPADDPENEEAA